MISAQTLAMIRRVVASTLTDTCLIERETDDVGDYGEPTHTWENVASNVPCRLIQVGDRSTSGQSEVGSAESLRQAYRLIVKRTVALGVDMRVTINGVVYQIVRVEIALTDEAYHAAIVERL